MPGHRLWPGAVRCLTVVPAGVWDAQTNSRQEVDCRLSADNRKLRDDLEGGHEAPARFLEREPPMTRPRNCIEFSTRTSGWEARTSNCAGASVIWRPRGSLSRSRMAPLILEQLLMSVGLACQPRHGLGRGRRRRKQIPYRRPGGLQVGTYRDDQPGGENVLGPV